MSSHTEFPSPEVQPLTVEEAYRAMYRFWDKIWEMRGKKNGDDLSLFLSFMTLTQSGQGPMDQAMWADWLEAIEEVRGSH